LGNEVAPLVQALEGKELKLDSDGDSSIQASTDDTFILKTNSNTALSIDANGHITKPLQPAFLAKPSSEQTNITTTTTIVFDTEVFDQNGDFASNTFTAPVTGRYHISFVVRLNQIDTAADYHRPRLVTSNNTFNNTICDFGGMSTDPAYWFFTFSLLVDMDANDTASVMYTQGSNGSNQTDISVHSHFSGYLVC